MFTRDSAQVVIAEVEDPARQISFRGCRMTIPGRPFFSRLVTWGAAGETIVVNDVTDFRLTVWRAGQRKLVVTRDVAAIEVTRAEALKSRAVREGYRIRWPGGGCQVTPEELLDAMGFEDTVSPIGQIVVAPDGSFWVRHRAKLDDRWEIDVFTSDGRYVGTLPSSARFPSAFLSSQRFVALETSRDAVPILVVYRIERR